MEPEDFIDLALEIAVEHDVALELRAGSGMVIIDHIGSLFRGEGHASEALREVVSLADAHDITLGGFVSPTDEHGLTRENLLSWYKRLGFEETGNGSEILRRPSLSTPAPGRR